MVCVFTHSVHGVERSRKVGAAWRALFLLVSEGARLEAAPMASTEGLVLAGILSSLLCRKKDEDRDHRRFIDEGLDRGWDVFRFVCSRGVHLDCTSS